MVVVTLYFLLLQSCPFHLPPPPMITTFGAYPSCFGFHMFIVNGFFSVTHYGGCSVARSCPQSMWPHGLQHARLP